MKAIKNDIQIPLLKLAGGDTRPQWSAAVRVPRTAYIAKQLYHLVNN